jgi:enoyl-CoA hydratase/carnithine racemase
MLSSRVVLGEEAASMGLVNAALPAEELMGHTMDYATRMASEIAPSSLREVKRQLYADLHGDVGTAVAHSERRLDEMMTGPDYTEGVAALTERRPPDFRPRPTSRQ